jgi:hypothetical protein
MHEHVWHLVEAEQMTIATKHGESLVAYRVNRMKKDAGASGVVHQPGSDPSSR